MMTLDAARAATLSAQPWARLDELVRAELAAGRSVRQVGDELRAMQTGLEDTPGLSDDGGDALLDTLESLHQMGPRKYWYIDPPRLPTADEVGALPRWARVALAARSTRRTLPLFRHELPDAPASHLRILEGPSNRPSGTPRTPLRKPTWFTTGLGTQPTYSSSISSNRTRFFVS